MKLSTFLPLLIIFPFTTSKTPKIIPSHSLTYIAPLSTDLIHKYSTKLTWSRARQDTLDKLAQSAHEEYPSSSKPPKLITDVFVNEKHTNERSKGRYSLTEMVTKTLVRELLNSLLEQLQQNDREWVMNHRDGMKDLQVRCRQDSEDDVQCGVSFRSLMEILGFGFDLKVGLKSNLVEEKDEKDDRMNMDEDDNDDDDVFKNSLVVGEESSYKIVIYVVVICSDDLGEKDGIQGQVGLRSIRRLIKKANAFLLVKDPKVLVDEMPSMEVQLLERLERKRFYEYYMHMRVQQQQEETQKRIEEKEKFKQEMVEEQAQEQMAQKPTPKKNHHEVLKEQEEQHKEHLEKQKNLDDMLSELEVKLDEFKAMRKDKAKHVSFDDLEEERLWMEMDKLMEKIDESEMDVRGFDEKRDKKQMDELLANMQIDLSMERYMKELHDEL